MGGEESMNSGICDGFASPPFSSDGTHESGMHHAEWMGKVREDTQTNITERVHFRSTFWHLR